MSGLEKIKDIEKILGISLRKVEMSEISPKDFFAVNPFLYPWSFINEPYFHDKGARNYCIDEKGNIIGLSLDYLPIHLLLKLEPNLEFLKNLRFLSLRNVGLKDFAFLKEFTSLTSLDLSNNQIQDVSFLKELTALTSLSLKSNNLKDFSFLKDLTGLTSLSLNGSYIQDTTFLKELINLTALNLSSTAIKDISFLKELTSLTELYLSYSIIQDDSFLKELNGITKLDLGHSNIRDCSFLKEFTYLKSLYLGHIKLKDGTFFKELTNLSLLNLSYTEIKDISFLKELTNLKILDLSDNKIKDFSILKDFKYLTSLNLSNNNIQEFSFLKELTNLTSLEIGLNGSSDVSFLKDLKNLFLLGLSFNEVRDFSFLKELSNLTWLDLSHMQIKDVTFLKELTNLIYLNLCNTKIQDFSFLKKLNSLSSLDLSQNQIQDFSFLKELLGLTSLDLSDTKIKDFAFLKDLKGLTSLNLRKNNIQDVTFLKDFKRFTEVNLKDNQIEEIPEWLIQIGLEIKINIQYATNCINLFQNNIVTPPKEIVEQGNIAIEEWYRQLEKYDEEKAYEAKVMLIGEPNSGKTTFMELLFDKNYPVPQEQELQPSTLGIEIKRNRIFRNPNEGLPDINGNIWDFGGQDIQYMLHQYFLSEDSVYILITDGRSGKTRYGYWFQIINQLAKNSPVLVLLNKHNGQTTVIPFDNKQYKNIFQELNIIDLGEIDFGNLGNKWNYIIDEIAVKLSKLSIMGQRILKPWKAIRKEIEGLKIKKKHITLDEFEEICYKNGLEERKEVKFLLKYFHKIGFALNFEEESLQNTVFLDPNWITRAIYDALISDETLFEDAGKFKKERLYEHWQGKQYNKTHKQTYSQTECNYILNLMLRDRFDVCYPISHQPGYYVIPRKLPDLRPVYEWNPKDNLHFRFQYPFMPEGLISRLIVRLNEYIDGNKVWLSGVILKEIDTTAEILQNETTQEGIKYIGIRIAGENIDKRRKMLRNIRREIEHIHRHSFPYIIFSERVVCNCRICEKEDNPNFYDYEDLRIYAENNENEIFCTKGKQRVEIRKMIDEIFTIEDFDEKGNKKPVESREKKLNVEPLKVFISYSKHDKKHLTKLNKQLSSLISTAKINKWDDTDLIPAEDWDDRITEKLKEADIILLLVSDNFMSTKYIINKEVPSALKSEQERGTLVIPIILDYCKWEILEFAKNTALPDKAHPITDKEWSNQNKAWLNVVNGIDKAVDDINKKRNNKKIF